eukprot:m.186645 g.186645  ORF g.186645 m.186645 type:complete len:500 (-) comp16849_c0_seq1:115-1614(-)
MVRPVEVVVSRITVDDLNGRKVTLLVALGWLAWTPAVVANSVYGIGLVACTSNWPNQTFGFYNGSTDNLYASHDSCISWVNTTSPVQGSPCEGKGVEHHFHWAVNGSTIVSTVPGVINLCLGVHPLGWAKLLPCSHPDTQFDINFSQHQRGPAMHQASGLCLTLNPNPWYGPGCPPTPPPTPGPTPTGTTPCDIYADGGTPCVAAHSMVRALYSTHNGSLYQVNRSTDQRTLLVGVNTTGGYADISKVDAFCNGACVVSRIFDQSPHQNHLSIFGADRGVNATRLMTTVGGHRVYVAYFDTGMGYRNDTTNGIATGADPESMYAVVGGRHYNQHCCFDYGNAETNAKDDGTGTMEAINFGNSTFYWRVKPPPDQKGPWVLADLEDGMFPGNDTWNPCNTPIDADVVTAMLKGRPANFAIKAGDAQQGPLTVKYTGGRPQHGHPGYNPMRKQGAIILGTGGDNSHGAIGTFYEGAMTAGYAADTTDDAVQANIVSAGFGR